MRKIQIIVMLTLTVTLLSLMSVAASAVIASPLYQASGSGFLNTIDKHDNTIVFMFAFKARLQNDEGDAEGYFIQNNLTNGTMLQMEITYLEVEGKDVWLIGIVTNAIGGNAEIDTCREVKLQDNGEGKNIDMRSKLSSKCDGTGLGLIELDGGNIQIRR